MTIETVLVQINNSKAYKLLEDLVIIKVLKKSYQSHEKLSEKYERKLPSIVAQDLEIYTTRSEWKNDSI